MTEPIDLFLEQYFAEHGLSRVHEMVRYVEHNFVEHDYEAEMEKLISGEMKAVYKISAWLEGQKLEPLGRGGILVLANNIGQIFAAVKILGIETVKYGDVTPDLAAAFAIGDGSVESWKKCSYDYLHWECTHLKVDFDENTDILITWIEILYPPPVSHFSS